MVVTLKCPCCGELIAVQPVSELESKIAECPKCHERKHIIDYIPSLSLKVGDKNYQLHFGKQWVGREVETGGADIQIPDTTRYMSKRHAIFEVSCNNNGLVVTFEEHGKNATELQGISLEENDIIYVNINDCLQMGSVRLFLASEFEE